VIARRGRIRSLAVLLLHRLRSLPRPTARVRLAIATALAVALVCSGWFALARADVAPVGALAIGSTTTVTSTAQGDVYRYTLHVPTSTRVALRSLISSTTSRAKVAVFANGFGAGLVAAADLGNQAGDPTLGRPARSMNSWTSRDLPTWRRPRMVTATPRPSRATRSRRLASTASSCARPTNDAATTSFP